MLLLNGKCLLPVIRAMQRTSQRLLLGRWLRLVIAKAYASSSSDAILSPRTHEIRAWASPLAFKTSRRLKDVLSTAYWKSKNSFIGYYLPDMSASTGDDTFQLAFVAAGKHIQ